MTDRAGTDDQPFWDGLDEVESRRRYRSLVATFDGGVFELDADGALLAVDDAICATTGRARAVLLDGGLSAILHEADAARVRETLLDLVESAGDGCENEIAVATVEARVRTASDDAAAGTFRFSTVAGSEDRVIGRLELGGNMEAGATAATGEGGTGTADEARDAASERRYRALAEHFPNGVVTLFDRDIEYTLAAGQKFDELPVDPADLEGSRYCEVWDDDLASELEPLLNAALDGEQRSTEFEDFGRNWRLRSAPITDESGEVVGGMTMAQDVTERREAERQLRERERQLSTLMSNIPGMVYRCANEHGWPMEFVSDNAEAITGYQPQAFTHGDVSYGDDVVLEADQKELWANIQQEVDDRDPFAETYRIRTADGDQRWVTDYGRGVFEDGELVALEGVILDVTDRKRVEEARAESERRYRTLVESFPNGAVALFDRNLEYTTVGGELLEKLDVSTDEVVGTTVFDRYSEEVVDTLEPNLRAALDGEVREFEIEYEGLHLHVTSLPIEPPDGEITEGMFVVNDVTDRKERELFLEDAKAQLEAAAEAGAVGTWEWDIRNDNMVVGSSFAQLFGVAPEDARDGVSLEQFIDAIHEDDRDRVTEEIEAVVEDCGEYEAEYRVWNDDDELRWVVARGHVECDGDGNPITFPGALVDITRRKRTEQELERHRKQLRTLFEVLPVGIVVGDADGALVEANETAKEIWGGDVFDAGSVDEYDDRYTARWADTGEPVTGEEWAMARVLDGEHLTDPDIYEIEAADGQTRTIMLHGMPIRDEYGNVTRGVLTQTDITERREYQRKLEESNQRLEQFAYAASHDLQEPLRMVSSYLSLIDRRYGDEFDEDAQEFLTFAVDGANRMREMINALLEYSRVETRGDPFEPVDLDSVVDDLRQDFRMRIEETGADLTVDPLPTVHGDSDQLRQVLQNLLDNAMEYSDGDPRIHVSAERRGDEWVVSVEDDGIGIDADHRDQVFEVFQRLHSHEDHEGTGIGLALCRRIVERHGGEIWVDSAPGDGATFYFSIPSEDQRDD